MVAEVYKYLCMLQIDTTTTFYRQPFKLMILLHAGIHSFKKSQLDRSHWSLQNKNVNFRLFIRYLWNQFNNPSEICEYYMQEYHLLTLFYFHFLVFMNILPLAIKWSNSFEFEQLYLCRTFWSIGVLTLKCLGALDIGNLYLYMFWLFVCITVKCVW